MSNYKTVGAVVSPGRTFEAVFFEEEGELRRYPVIALEILVKEDEKEGNSTMTQPLCYVAERGDIFSMQDIEGVCLGLEMEGKKKDWTEEIKDWEDYLKEEEDE